MSADNWGICPRCHRDKEEAHADLVEKAKTSYGKVPEAEYLRLQEQAQREVSHDYTLREDYAIYTGREGAFYIKYNAHCTECGFNHTFKHQKWLELDGDD